MKKSYKMNGKNITGWKVTNHGIMLIHPTELIETMKLYDDYHLDLGNSMMEPHDGVHSSD